MNRLLKKRLCLKKPPFALASSRCNVGVAHIDVKLVAEVDNQSNHSIDHKAVRAVAAEDEQVAVRHMHDGAELVGENNDGSEDVLDEGVTL